MAATGKYVHIETTRKALLKTSGAIFSGGAILGGLTGLMIGLSLGKEEEKSSYQEQAQIQTIEKDNPFTYTPAITSNRPVQKFDNFFIAIQKRMPSAIARIITLTQLSAEPQ